MAWVLGFLSGVGFAASGLDPLNNMDGEGIWAWIDNYCRAHPIEQLSEATAAFVMEHPR
jgi:hydrogenase/urease accessory protein HupE